jgi:hypothetical protein
MKSPGQRRGGRGAGALFRDGRERGHSRICHPSVDDEVDHLPWCVIGPPGNVRSSAKDTWRRNVSARPPWGTQELERSIEPER